MNPAQLVVNYARRLAAGGISSFFQGDSKRVDAWKDYGFPDNPVFLDFYMQYRRNGFAKAGVNRAIEKTWQDNPWLLEHEEPHDQTTQEKLVEHAFERLQFWAKLKEADRMSRVGEYSGLILRIADDKLFNQPVESLTGGLDALVEIIPAWQGQLKPSEWNTNERDLEYGKPTMYRFQEAEVPSGEENQRAPRSFDVHPDRVIIWSKDGLPLGDSVLEAGLNDLITLAKIIGAGGEGFWKNAKSAPHLNMSPDASIDQLAAALGVTREEVPDAMNEQVEAWQTGLDKLLLTQGIDSKSMNVQLPDPEQFIQGPLQSFCASIGTPITELIGHQSGERASTENQSSWNQFNMARRTGYAIPNIRRMIERLVKFGILPDLDWYLDWSDLTEATGEQKREAGKDMAEINQRMLGSGEVFTPDEIREAMGYEPAEHDDLEIDDEQEPETNSRKGRFIVNLRRKDGR